MSSILSSTQVICDNNFQESKTEDECTTPTSKPSEHNFNKNPLVTDVVVKNLFEYFGFQDLKNLRPVCQIWNSTAEPILRKRAKIVFQHTNRGPLQFLNTFNYCKTQLPFTEFIFNEECLISDAAQFFSEYGKNIKHLKFQHVNMFTEKVDNQKISSCICNITEWISECNLTELCINSHTGTKLVISIQKLITVKNLRLENCILLLQEDVRISPSIISLVNLVYTFDILETPEEFLLNDSFDFHKAKEIYINHSTSTIPLCLDVSRDIAEVERMSVKSVRIVNWENCRWSVSNLEVDSISSVHKISMKVKKLKIVNVGTRRRIDLYFLPGETLERLTLQNGVETEFFCSNSIYWRSLKTLEICVSFIGNTIALPHFTNCPNLSNIILSGYSAEKLLVDLNWLPKNLKKLEIGNAIKFRDSREGTFSKNPFCINILTLRPYSFKSIFYILQKVHPDVLIIEGCKETFETIEKFVQRNVKLKKVIVSSYAVPNTLIHRKESSFSNLGDKTPLSYYFFENMEGRILTQKEFNDLTTL